MREQLERVYEWFDERLNISSVVEAALYKEVPVHRASVIYYLGGMTLFFFMVQVVTGILLMLYYRPSADQAFESVEFIMTSVPFGWLVRSIHSWSANLLVFFAFVHLATVFFAKAYRPSRELTWVTGCVLLFIAMGFGFSGYLLPWNQLSFFATKVGTDIAGVVPVVGEWMLRFLRGGERVTGGTLSRFYGWHVAILPALTGLVLGLHLLLVQLLSNMRELTVLTARAERMVLTARQGGVEVRDALAEIDQAVDSQIELEVLVHGFATEEGTEFDAKHAEGLEHVEKALASAQARLDELVFRRRGLVISLVFIALVLVGLAMKIHALRGEG